jgi:hypothetical protein
MKQETVNTVFNIGEAILVAVSIAIIIVGVSQIKYLSNKEGGEK